MPSELEEISANFSVPFLKAVYHYAHMPRYGDDREKMFFDEPVGFGLFDTDDTRHFRNSHAFLFHCVAHLFPYRILFYHLLKPFL